MYPEKCLVYEKVILSYLWDQDFRWLELCCQRIQSLEVYFIPVYSTLSKNYEDCFYNITVSCLSPVMYKNTQKPNSGYLMHWNSKITPRDITWTSLHKLETVHSGFNSNLISQPSWGPLHAVLQCLGLASIFQKPCNRASAAFDTFWVTESLSLSASYGLENGTDLRDQALLCKILVWSIEEICFCKWNSSSKQIYCFGSLVVTRLSLETHCTCNIQTCIPTVPTFKLVRGPSDSKSLPNLRCHKSGQPFLGSSHIPLCDPTV